MVIFCLNLGQNKPLPAIQSQTFVFHPLQFLSMDGKESSIPKGTFDMCAFSLKQMAEASESEGRQGNTSGPDQSVLRVSALSGCISQ